MSYRPTPITQRDGSPLANSNCRCASISAGLDWDTQGGKKSTGAKMRSYMSDQSGGTDSSDASQAWTKGYSESLSVRDGYTFDNALQDLDNGSLVHLDVWHASTSGSGICRSGSGAYGHTIAVLPERSGDGWLVNDPWCSPPKWASVSEASLRNGAEEWGRRVYGAAAMEADWPTAGTSLRAAIVRRIVKRFMDLSYPGHIRAIPEGDDTGGAQSILFTRTQAHAGEDMGTAYALKGTPIGLATTTVAIGLIPTQGGEFYQVPIGTKRNVFAVVTISDGPYDGDTAYLVQIPSGQDETGLLLSQAADYVPTPPGGDGDTDARDAEWREWLLAGSPGFDE